MFHLFVIPFIAADLLAGAFDAFETLRGLKLKSGVEGNSVINFMSRFMSPATAIVTYNLVKTAAFAALSIAPNPALLGGALGCFISSVAGHIQGGWKWRYLNNGGKIDRDRLYSWWEKMLGMGWD